MLERTSVHRPLNAKSPQLGHRIVSFSEGFDRPVNDLDLSFERLPSGGNSNFRSSWLGDDRGESGQAFDANPSSFADAGPSMVQSHHRIPPSPSLTAGSSLNSSLAPPTPMSPVAAVVGKTGDFSHQKRIPIRRLPFISEEPDQDSSKSACDALHEVSIKIEKDSNTEEIDNEVTTGGICSWLEDVVHVVHPKSSLMSDHSKEEHEKITSPILDSLRDGLIDRIMDKFWLAFDQKWKAQANQCAGNSPTSSGESSAHDNPENICSSTSQSTFSVKRQKSSDDELPDENGNKKPRRQTNFSGPSKGLNSQGRFACPFRKHDPQKYNMYNRRVCALTHWDTIARVK
jgi:hypothetical protein